MDWMVALSVVAVQATSLPWNVPWLDPVTL
jgi:hypothetical protein